MKLVQRIGSAIDTVLFEVLWSNFGKIGPGSMKEAHALHRGAYLGLVKIWNPYTLAKELQKYEKMDLEEFEDREKHYETTALTVLYTVKILGVSYAVQNGITAPTVVCEAMP